MPSAPHEKLQLLWQLMSEFISSYKNSISGRYDANRYAGGASVKSSDPLTGGAKIKKAFHSLYQDLADYKATSEYSLDHIETAIQMHEGDSLPGFPSVDVFIYLINPQLDRLREPALDLISDTYISLDQIASNNVNRIFNRFPGMQGEIMEIVTKVLQKEREKARTIVEALIDAEMNYLFTNNRGFKDNSNIMMPN